MIQIKTIKFFSTGKRIQFLFATLRLETHANCSFDYLEVYDGDAIGKKNALKNWDQFTRITGSFIVGQKT